MREIKFRVWFKGEMITQPLNTPFGASRLFGFLDANAVNEFDNVMQYTGIKDKNGKEIYEGDILNASMFPDGDGKEGVFVIVFEDGAFRKKYNEWPIGLIPIPLTESELSILEDIVIGNIYENPGLSGSEK